MIYYNPVREVGCSPSEGFHMGHGINDSITSWTCPVRTQPYRVKSRPVALSVDSMSDRFLLQSWNALTAPLLALLDAVCDFRVVV